MGANNRTNVITFQTKTMTTVSQKQITVLIFSPPSNLQCDSLWGSVTVIVCLVADLQLAIKISVTSQVCRSYLTSLSHTNAGAAASIRHSSSLSCHRDGVWNTSSGMTSKLCSHRRGFFFFLTWHSSKSNYVSLRVSQCYMLGYKLRNICIKMKEDET